MPKTINIPARQERHCAPCEYHKCTASFHVRRGEGSYREWSCMHPQAMPLLVKSPADPVLAEIKSQMNELTKELGRPIGRTELQPHWCPLRKSRWRSFALYSPDAGLYCENPTTDDHDTREGAEGVCTLLARDGFGGDHKIFPIKTWVEEIYPKEPNEPTPPNP